MNRSIENKVYFKLQGIISYKVGESVWNLARHYISGKIINEVKVDIDFCSPANFSIADYMNEYIKELNK